MFMNLWVPSSRLWTKKPWGTSPSSNLNGIRLPGYHTFSICCLLWKCPVYTFLNLLSSKLTMDQSLSKKQVLRVAPRTPIWVSSMSPSSCCSVIFSSIFMYGFSYVTNGRTQNLWSFSLSNLMSFMTVRYFCIILRLFICHECLRNISWLPGNVIHCWPYCSWASVKNSQAAVRTSISRAFLSWNKSPNIIMTSMPVFLQYSRRTRSAHSMSLSLP